jgi:hypothetical protein
MIASACSSALTAEPHQTIPTSLVEQETLPGGLSHRIANLRPIDIGNGGDDVGILDGKATKHGPYDGIIVEGIREGMKVRLERLVVVARLRHEGSVPARTEVVEGTTIGTNILCRSSKWQTQKAYRRSF